MTTAHLFSNSEFSFMINMGPPKFSVLSSAAAENDQKLPVLSPRCCCCVVSRLPAPRLPCSFISAVNLAACQLSRGQNVLHAPLFCPSSVSHLLKDHKLWRTVSSANRVPSSKSISAIFSLPFQIFPAPCAFQPHTDVDEIHLSFSDQSVTKLLSSYDLTPLVASRDLHAD